MNTYQEYAIIEAKIKELETAKESLRVRILEDMVDRDEKKIDTPFGSFSVSKRKTWTYSPKVDEIKEKLDALKAKEESCGDAKYIETPSLRFTQIKL